MEPRVLLREILAMYREQIKRKPIESFLVLYYGILFFAFSIYTMIEQSLPMIGVFCAILVIFVLWISREMAKSSIFFQRLADGQCLECGYDLRGTVEPRCPECGIPFDPSSRPVSR